MDRPDGAPPLCRPWRLFHPLCGSSIWNWVRLLTASGGFDMQCLHQIANISTCSIFHSHDRARYWALYGQRLRRLNLKSPVFIIGHWRSGTTMIHNLLARDPALAYPTLWHAILPKTSVSAWYMRPLIERMMPEHRPMDNMATHIRTPYEEEAGMANLSTLSFWHAFFFPENATRYFERGVMFDGLGRRDIEKWKRIYVNFLKMVSLGSEDRRLVLKNPANTARIPTLLEMFPDARFIFVYRNPYVVYPSTVWLHRAMIRAFSLQGQHIRGIEERAFAFYRRLLDRYFATRHLVPEGRLVEIRFEDLEADPVGRMQAAYDTLGLEGFEAARPGMQQYADSVSHHRKNGYKLDLGTIEQVRKEWATTIDRWGYDVPVEVAQIRGDSFGQSEFVSEGHGRAAGRMTA
jgi:hypothetical protein